MHKIKIKKIGIAIYTLLAFSYILILYGAIPFVSMPTLGQAFWTMGFAQSMANQSSVISIYSPNIGNPEPASMAFGLAGGYVTSLFIRLGLNAGVAYTVMNTFWLTVAFYGAYKIGKLFKVNTVFSITLAILWLSFPISWWHTGYSMVALGIALLPFYFWSFFKTIYITDIVNKIQILKIFIFSISSFLISIFMDGYTFMMYVTGSALLLISCYIIYPKNRKNILKYTLPIYISSIVLAYLLFTLYIGKSTFSSHEMNFFRGWGIDLTFLLQPTERILWFWDYIGFSVPRSNKDFFGDASVWNSVFALPIILFAIFSWLIIKKTHKLATPVFLIAVFGLYMSLGPSLKYNSFKPKNVTSLTMDAKYAIVPTGSALISKNLPGFKVMRASYRWVALAFFALWFIVVLSLSTSNAQKNRWKFFGIIFILILMNTPDLHKHLNKKINNYESFIDIEATLVKDLEKSLIKGEQVVFLPWRNDFFINYLAPRVGVNTYNIGGDKNLIEARKNWPKTIKKFKMGQIDSTFDANLLNVLMSKDADVIVLPYIDMLWAAHSWPAPLKYKSEILSVLKTLKNKNYITIQNNHFYSTVRLTKEASYLSYLELLKRNDVKVKYPIELNKEENISRFLLEYILKDGWYNLESDHVWSSKIGILQLIRPELCTDDSFFSLEFNVFNTSLHNPKEIIFSINNKEVYKKLFSNNNNRINIPINCKQEVIKLTINNTGAESPSAVSKSNDARILGIALKKISIIKGGNK